MSVVAASPTAPTPLLRRLWRPGWPIRWFLLGFPLWWLLGLTGFILIVLAVPMSLWLLRRKHLTVPPAFGWWMLFLGCVVLSGVMLGLTAPNTVEGTFVGRLPGFGLRLLNYVAATVALLYVVNMPEDRLSTRSLVRMQGVFFLVVVLGGLAGVYFYDIELTSPFEFILPGSITSNRFASSLLHPSVAQVQGVLGYESARPSAPFVYTNIWGNNLSLLMVWFVIGFGIWGGTKSRVATGVVLAISVVPIIYSLNRGLWIGLIVATIYLAVRLALHGRTQLFFGFVLAIVALLVVALLSPLYGVVQERLANPHSDSARENTSSAAVTAALSSPILGYGSTRATVGSAQSIAVGRSASCGQCGNAAIGGAGQLWLLLIAQGFTGAVLYIGFFARTIWTYRHDRSAIAMGGVLVVLLGLVYLPVYGSAGTPLALYMIAVGLLWRQRRLAADPEPRPTVPRPRIPLRLT